MAKLKFGVFLPFYVFQSNPQNYCIQLKTIVGECERLGYDSVWLDDHLMYGESSILECWTTLSALAASTSHIRLGTMVACNAHRNPALLAKAAATLDVLSGGRLELGLGAGVQEAEHKAYGFGFPELAVRTEMLGEAIEVIKRLWTQPKAGFTGKYYSLKDAVCEPKPHQKPHPPIIVGGGAEATLKIAAKYADRFDWGYLSMGGYKRKLEALEKCCREIGRDFGSIERSCWPGGQILIAKNQQELTQKMAKCKPPAVKPEDFLKYTLAGTPDECRRALQVYVDLGVTYFMLFFADLPGTEGLTLFREVVEQLI